MSEPMQTTVMDPRGDVVLHVGPEDAPRRAFLVNSRVMSLASPVFAVMFDGRFAEGQGLSASTPRDILLPDDDPVAMELLLSISHMRAAKLAEEITHVQFADFAILCDKYDCIDTVRMCSRTWAAELLKDPKKKNFEKLIFTTYLLDLPVEFYNAARALIIHRRIIKASEIVHDSRFLPLIVIDQLNEAKLDLLDLTVPDVLIPKEMLEALQSKYEHGREEVMESVEFYIQEALAEVSRPISEFEKCISDIEAHTQEVIGSFDGPTCDVGACECHDPLPFTKKVLEELRDLEKNKKGLCLDCIRCEATGKEIMKNCRVPHRFRLP